MEEEIKIVIIGGGSSYTLEVIKGLIECSKNINIKEVCLVDIEKGKEKQDIIANFARRMIRDSNMKFNITTTLNRKEALNCADFVITQFRVGTLDERIKDEKSAFTHGVIGDEKLGAVSLSIALKTIPVFLEIINDVKEICSDAFVLNFTNPIGMLTDVVVNETGFKNIIGISLLGLEMEQEIADLLELRRSKVNIEFAGVTNILYALSINANGECYNKRILEKLDVIPSKMMPFSSRLAKGLDAIPCKNHKYYYKKEAFLEREKEAYQMGITRGELVRGLEENILEHCKDTSNIEIPKELRARKGHIYRESLIKLLDGIVNNKRTIQVLNVMNNGVISDLYENDSVEVNCIVDSNGAKALSVGRLPIGVKPLMVEIKAFEKLCVEAALSGNYYKAYQALCINQLVASDDKAKLILDDFLINNKEYLPEFSKRIDKIERNRRRQSCKKDSFL